MTLLENFLDTLNQIQGEFQARMASIDQGRPEPVDQELSPDYAAQPEEIEDRIEELRHLLGLEAIWNAKRTGAEGDAPSYPDAGAADSGLCRNVHSLPARHHRPGHPERYLPGARAETIL